jgi:hypothetical protein
MMSVYVDKIRDFSNTVKGYAKRRCSWWSHMIADNEEKLDTFATKIGLKHEWGQHRERPDRFHYDVIPSKRALAIKHGAIEISNLELIEIRKRQNKTHCKVKS